MTFWRRACLSNMYEGSSGTEAWRPMPRIVAREQEGVYSVRRPSEHCMAREGAGPWGKF